MSIFLIFVISSLLPCHSRPVIFRSSSFLVIPRLFSLSSFSCFFSLSSFPGLTGESKDPRNALRLPEDDKEKNTVIPVLDRGIPRLPDQVRQWQREKSLDPDISLIYPRNALRPRTTLVWMPGLNPNMTEKTSKTGRKKNGKKDYALLPCSVCTKFLAHRLHINSA